MALTPMMQQYLKIKEKYSDCILFYRLGDFYEMFFDHAKICSRELELTLTGKDCGLEERAPMCGIPYHSVNTYIPKLIERGYKIAICEQIEDAKEAKGIVKRDVVKIITPGTITDLSMLDDKKNNYILAILPSPKQIGIAFCDISTGDFYVSSVSGCNVEEKIFDEISRIYPSEIVVFDKLQNSNLFIKELESRVDIYISKFNDDKENVYSKKLLNNMDTEISQIEKKAICLLLNYTLNTQKTDISQLNKINKYSICEFMQLDISSRRNLEIVENIRGKDKKGSLLWVLDKTVTSMGARNLRQWIEFPLINKKNIEKRQNAVELIFQNHILKNDLQDILKMVYDIERILSKVVNGSVNARELITLKNSLQKLPFLKEKLKEILLIKKDVYILELYNNLDTLEDVFDLLEISIDNEPKITIKEGQIIKSGFNKEVDELREASTKGQNWLMELETREKSITTISKLKVGYNRVFGYYIEVTNSYKDKIPEDRYIRKQTLAGAERYITQELKEMEDKILGAKEKLVEIEYKLFCEIRLKIASQIIRIQNTAKVIAVLDTLTSLASVALENNYVKPIILENGNIEIVDGRHPVVEKALRNEEFIPNDTILNNEQDRFLIITGPNMSGKSTYMRQVAVITYMAQIGSFVPANNAKISIVDRIFTRIGASDDLSMGQSTFMVEMQELSNILKNATKDSLVILDEIGRGTSTYDGLAIAWATVEYISNLENMGTKTLFATHYHELTELEEKIEGVKNYSVEVKEKGDEVIFLRKIVRGGADESYGIYVAKLAGVSKTVIKRAKEILKELENVDLAKKSINSRKKNITEEEIQVDMFNYKMAEISKILERTQLDELSPKDALDVLYTLKGKLD